MTDPRSSPAPAAAARPGAAERKASYDQAASWAADVNGALRSSRRIAWIVAAVACAVAVLEALALAALAPLKTVVPYTILVDRSSGYVETVKPLAPGPLSQNTVVTQSFLVQYVLARETFDASDLRNNYQKVMQWSAGDARASYQHEFDRTDPDSPLKLYSPTTTVSVAVENVAQLSPTTALVRFTTTRHEAGAPSGEQRAYTAVMAYHFSGAPMRMEDRFTNPLGFEVTRYRRDTDTVSGAALPAGATTP